MSDTQTTPGPRRSQRERKTPKAYTSIESAPNKRKRNDTDAEDGPEISDPEDDPSANEGDDNDDDEVYRAPKPKPKTTMPTRKGKGKATTKPRGPPPAKKPRTAKTATQKVSKATVRRSKKPKGDEDAFDAAQVAKETKISNDNPLFNAIMNPSAALQSTAEDFLESLDQSPGVAQAELINLILRACGCSDSVDADEAVDYDGVVDALDNFTEGLKNDDSPVYPLTSKLPAFKRFRKSLSEFIERLIASSADLGNLYTSDLMATLQTWVIAMSSSQIRSFRHTATVVALEVETAMCDVAAAVEKEAEVVGRQREGEKKRKATNKGGGVREKELEGKAAEIRERRAKLAEFLSEFVDGVFVHRYRDLDPNIRAECVRAIGLWFKKYPGHFLDPSYLRYVGWVLSDSNTLVRLEAVKALSGVYEQVDYIGSLNHFTQRFKPRLIEMAQGDTELPIRVAVIQVLGAVDSHSLLDDEEREKLCLLVFDEEGKVRQAVSSFVRGVWEDLVEEQLVGRKPTKKDKARAGVKAIAGLFVKWGKTLDKQGGVGEDEYSSNVDEGGKKEVAALVSGKQKGRTALAVEALWEDVEPFQDWECLLDVLLLDHSAAGEEQPESSRAKKKGNGNDTVVDEAWRLTDVEESVLLEVLVAALRRAKEEAAGGKKGEEETVANDITRALIKGLHRLFIKHQTDPNRIAEVLLIPLLMNLDLYLEMRMITAYAGLWDDVIKQLLSHSSVTVLMHAVACVRHFLEATSLSNTNSTKILELEDELSSSLHDAVAGRDEIEVASFTEDEVLSLGALCSRLTVLAGTRDMTAWIDEDEGGKQSSAWDIISALVERGRLGYKEEEMMIDQAIHLLSLHLMWKLQQLTNTPEPSADAETQFQETFRVQRDSLLEKLVEYAVGSQSNTVEGVKRAAFQNLIHLHILFCPVQTVAADGGPLPTASISITLDDEVQYRCAGFIQAEIERYADEIDGFSQGTHLEKDDNDDEGTSDEDSHDEAGTTGKKKKTSGAKKGENRLADPPSRTRLEQEYVFMNVVYAFMRAIRAGAIHPRHSSTLLAHYGRLGPAFDSCSKAVVDVLREEGMNKKNGEVVVAVVSQALREAFTLVLDSIVQDESYCIALSKLLASCLVVRGAQLAVILRLESEYVVQIHIDLLTWIGKRIVINENNKNKKAQKTVALFFKVLLPLLAVIQSKDALKIKAHMDQILAQAKVDISTTSKIWEPQRAYEKRLATAISKDKGIKGRKVRTQGLKSAVVVSGEEEETEGDNIRDDVPVHLPRPRPRRLQSHAHNDSLTPLTEEGEEETGGEPQKGPSPHPEATPDNSPQITNTLLPQSPARSIGPESHTNGLITPQQSNKRGRSEEAVENEDEQIQNDTLDTPTQPSDFQIRRKRIRY